MRKKTIRRATALAASVAAVLGTGALAAATASAAGAATAKGAHDHDGSAIRHVLLISADGLHQQDLAWYVHAYPNSVLAGLYRHGLEYSSALTPFPSDSSPGMVAQVTGGNPKTTGIYYDDTYNADLFPPGTTNCSGLGHARHPVNRLATVTVTRCATEPVFAIIPIQAGNRGSTDLATARQSR
jgi:hypothetical protein